MALKAVYAKQPLLRARVRHLMDGWKVSKLPAFLVSRQVPHMRERGFCSVAAAICTCVGGLAFPPPDLSH